MASKAAAVRAAVQESIALADKVQARLVALTDENVALRERLAVSDARLRRLQAAVRDHRAAVTADTAATVGVPGEADRELWSLVEVPDL